MAELELRSVKVHTLNFFINTYRAKYRRSELNTSDLQVRGLIESSMLTAPGGISYSAGSGQMVGPYSVPAHVGDLTAKHSLHLKISGSPHPGAPQLLTADALELGHHKVFKKVF